MPELLRPEAIHYLGPADSYSGILAEQLYPDESGVLRIAQPTFRRITHAVEETEAAVGLLPMENSTSSTVHENADAMFDRRLIVIQEALLAISLHLIGLEGAQKREVTAVYSHVQALAQCRKYIRAHQLEEVETASTAAAAGMVLAANNPAIVCLGGLKVVERPGLTVIERNVADHPKKNKTKFFVVRRREGEELSSMPEANGDQLKLTLVVELMEKIGSLGRYLVQLEEQGANLSTIESRPNPVKDDYYFWMDVEMPAQRVPDFLAAARESARSLDVLGIYKPGQTYQS